MPARTPEEIRSSIVETRQELAVSVEQLRNKVAVLTDWRRQVNQHRAAAVVVAATVGFVVGRRLFRRRN
jgi:negative regulator of sigma E activity